MKLTKIFVVAILLLVCSNRTEAQDPVFDPTNITTFTQGGQTYRIWASIRNVEHDENPELWQFFYDPPFLLESDEGGHIRTEVVDAGGGHWRVKLPVHTESAEIRKRALARLKSMYPAHEARLSDANVFALPMRHLDVRVPDELRPPGITLVAATYDFGPPPAGFTVTFDATDRAAADALVSGLGNLRLDYTYKLRASKAKRNWLRLKMTQLKSSTLYAKLSGVAQGGEIAYVHRDDMRRLTERLHTEVDVQQIVEDPSAFNASIAKELIERYEKVSTDASKGYDDQKWARTFAAEDLKPTKVTKTINDMFKKDSGKETWHYNGQFEGSGGINLFSVIGADASTKGEFTKDGLKEFLREHNIHAEWEGERWDAKSLDVVAVNLSDFNNDQRFVQSLMLLEPAGDTEISGNLDVGAALLDPANLHPGIPARVAEVEAGLLRNVPIGTIIDWYRFDANTPLPVGYKLCDGGVIEDEESPFKGKAVPNLVDRFIMGVTATRVGETGGRADIPVAGNHDHGGKTSQATDNVPATGDGAYQMRNGPDLHKFRHDITADGKHDHGGENRPPYFGLIKLMRVR